jgi:O-antigen/teichoic acid export membrane protein
MPPHDTGSHRRVARSTLWNLFGYVAPTLVAFLALPPTVRLLGPERYGVLALVLVVHDYFNYFDFGLGRATTRFISSALHAPAGRQDVGAIFWTCLVYHVALGILVGALFWLILPLVSRLLLGGSPALIVEGRSALQAAALLPPVLLFMIAGRGALEAAQRFDLVTAVKVPLNSVTFLVPLWGAQAGLRLPGIILVFVLVRLAAGLVYLALCLHEFPGARSFRMDRSLQGSLFAFGGFVMATNLIGLLLVDGERFLIPGLVSVGALTYYAVPNDATTRLWILPASLASALFPIFTRASKSGDDQAGRLYADSTLYLLILFVPIVLIVEGFAGPLLSFWMGGDFASKAKVVLQVATLGVMLDSLARIPLSYLQAKGLPGIPARIRLWQLPAYGVASVLCIEAWGIVGAAWAWTFRIALETAILFAFVRFRGHIVLPREASGRLKRGLLVSTAALVAGGAVAVLWVDSLAMRSAGIGLLVASYIAYAWFSLIDSRHRAGLGFQFLRNESLPR